MKSAMKAVVLSILSFTLFGKALSCAQSSPGQFQHVIIVVQENRTPDNLFAGIPSPQPTQYNWFEPGVDLSYPPPGPTSSWCLGSCFDPGHQNDNWHSQNQNQTPACAAHPPACGTDKSLVTYCDKKPVCDQSKNWIGCGGQYGTPIPVPTCPTQTYVSDALDINGSQHVLDPYDQIATQWGFANYFYQTNQGGSEPAHDFLFGGTSAPSGILGQGYYNYFDANNPHTSPVGCEFGAADLFMINPDGNTTGDSTYPQVSLSPCFEHLTLSDLLESQTPSLTWKYYSSEPNGIWTAPNAIQHICGTPSGASCNNTDFTANVLPAASFFHDFSGGGPNLIPKPGQPPYCNLPSVAWIIPDGANSDHAGTKNEMGQAFRSTDIEGGPNWVATIINAVGQATCVEYGGRYRNQNPWSDTVIFVVWDDWGGWYDHVVGSSLYQNNFLENGLNTNGTCIPTSPYNGTLYPWWGCGYTYGFRVPFLVVSAYTAPNTVSGACGTSTTPPCGPLSNTAPHQHDFGSILGFVEYNFGLGIGCINSNFDTSGNPCIHNPDLPAGGYPFADFYAPEVQSGYRPLGDFFGSQFNQFPQGGITLVNNSFTEDYFYNFTGPYTDPDNDVIDNN